MFSATVAVNKCGCCGTQAIWDRHRSAGIAARSTGPAVMVPLAGVAKRSSRASSELFPAPFGPVRMIFSPGLMVRLTSSIAGRSRPG